MDLDGLGDSVPLPAVAEWLAPLVDRDPGLIGYLLASKLPVGIVADGHHLALETIQLVARIKAPNELVVVSDALSGLGMPPGQYELAGRTYHSDGTCGRLPDGTLAGSVLPFHRAQDACTRASARFSAQLNARGASQGLADEWPGSASGCEHHQCMKRFVNAYACRSNGLAVMGWIGSRRARRVAISVALDPTYLARNAVGPSDPYWPTWTISWM